MPSGPIESENESESHSVMSNSLQPHARLLCPWDSPGKNTGVDHHTLLPDDLPDPRIDPRIEPASLTSLLDWQAGSLLLVPPGKPITSWQVDGETMETVIDFIILGSKITEDGDCSNKIKRCLLLGRKVMTNLDNILKSRGITLPTNVCLVKAMVFPVVMYGCESWSIKKAEH